MLLIVDHYVQLYTAKYSYSCLHLLANSTLYMSTFITVLYCNTSYYNTYYTLT